MKVFSTLLVLGIMAAAVADTVDAQTRYVRYEQAGDLSWAELDGTTIHQLSDAPYLGGQRTGRTTTESAVTMKAPVDPNLVFMTAFNFRSHITGDPAEYPGLFTVPASSIIGPGENIVRPAESQNLHYEAEMVVVIGRRAMNITPEEAPDYIFGVAAGNDVSERGRQATSSGSVRREAGRSTPWVQSWLRAWTTPTFRSKAASTAKYDKGRTAATSFST